MIKFKYVIIGNSAAGIASAEAIRSKDQEGTLAIISDEPYAAYGRPLISEFLATRCDMKRMLYRPFDFYEKIKARTFFGHAVTDIDSAAKIVKTDNGQEIAYEKLLLATGGKPIVPPIKGLNQKSVYTFTKLDDAKTLDAVINKGQKAIVIGGGLIGLSLAEALVKRNVEVTIVEMRDRVLNTILDEEASALVKERLNEYGIKVMTNSSVTEVIEDPMRTGVAGGVVVDGKITIKADIICAAIGVTPRTDLAKIAGIEINRGILVNKNMQTSNSDIYAAGDVTEAYDFMNNTNAVIPVWPNAYAQGRIAGLNMAGTLSEYDGGTILNSLKYFKLAVTTAGQIVPPDDSYEVVSC
ncbi:MAG: FAD-dependent oxidoreductase, partial [Chloroflexi bacterium]|nr:FAD-dependent oxidoreductase [Chloroflexota bacterium]